MRPTLSDRGPYSSRETRALPTVAGGSCSRYTHLMPYADTRKGEILVIAGAVLWGLFPVVSKSSFSSVPPLLSGGLSVLLATVFFAAALTVKRQWADLAKREAWFDILLATLL